MSIRLFVGNLPYDTLEAALKDHFATVAPVTYLAIPKDRETGRARNFAFVEFAERAHAEEAVRRLNNQLFNGRPLSVSEARPREEGRAPNTAARPPLARSYANDEPAAAPAAPSADKSNRNFGPDAAPQRRSKGKGAPKAERAARGPMREIVTGQFGGDDDDYEDDENYDDFDDYETEVDEADADDLAQYLNKAANETEPNTLQSKLITKGK